ncbi:MAG: 4'-phosphopantetheinyl transferase family protein [Oceanococcus sp.]
MSRALKTYCLAQALGCTAKELIFVEDENGKPQLQDSQGWQFNLSHSGDTAVMVVARQPVGIDLERQQRQANWSGIGERMFHASELHQLRAMPQARQAARAVQLWTAKEAWAKATGVGMAGMQDAPAMHWQTQTWALPLDARDALLQAAVSDEWFVSVCLLGGRIAATQWQAVQWLGSDQFAATTAPAVTELSA